MHRHRVWGGEMQAEIGKAAPEKSDTAWRRCKTIFLCKGRIIGNQTTEYTKACNHSPYRTTERPQSLPVVCGSQSEPLANSLRRAKDGTNWVSTWACSNSTLTLIHIKVLARLLSRSRVPPRSPIQVTLACREQSPRNRRRRACRPHRSRSCRRRGTCRRCGQGDSSGESPHRPSSA